MSNSVAHPRTNFKLISGTNRVSSNLILGPILYQFGCGTFVSSKWVLGPNLVSLKINFASTILVLGPILYQSHDQFCIINGPGTNFIWF